MGNLPRLDKTADAIDGWWRARNVPKVHKAPSIHISDLGDNCNRRVWNNSCRLAQPELDAQKLRQIDSARRYNQRFTESLRGVGIKIWNEGKELIALDGALSGKIDGMALGVLEAPKTEHLLKYVVCKDRYFRELKNYGVKKAYFKHYIQVQVQMGLLGVKRCLYLAVNKNTDDIFQERIKFDRGFFEAQMRRAEQISVAEKPPVKISENPKWYQCKVCVYKEDCHEQQ